ncbi:hypothetical protein AB1Y20_001319 [Prymnesium parvum]|uniref:Uncharacterized protein n=1 Tax=Prymnesium parvum TaxID=97485 RepID=A0AB34K7B8_PRYPA
MGRLAFGGAAALGGYAACAPPGEPASLSRAGGLLPASAAWAAGDDESSTRAAMLRSQGLCSDVSSDAASDSEAEGVVRRDSDADTDDEGEEVADSVVQGAGGGTDAAARTAWYCVLGGELAGVHGVGTADDEDALVGGVGGVVHFHGHSVSMDMSYTHPRNVGIR